MGNVGSITTRRWIKEEQLEKDIKAIVSSRFDNKIPVKKDFNFIVGFEYPWCVELWLENCHRISFRAPIPKWGWWIRCIIENELALLYDGWISDEGVAPEKWRGVPDKYPTFKSYMMAMSEGLPSVFAFAWRVIETQTAPKEVKATYG